MIELLVSVFILGLALLPMFDLLSRGARQVRVSREETLAVAINSELIDQIQCMPFADIPLEDSAHQPLLDKPIRNSDNGKCLSGEPLGGGNISTVLFLSPIPDGFERTLSIASVTDYLKRITVSVKWGTDMKHEVKYSAFMEYSP